jgi:hypothetical protein
MRSPVSPTRSDTNGCVTDGDIVTLGRYLNWRTMRFSLRTLLCVVSLSSIAGAVWFYWPTEPGSISTNDFHWYDYSVGVVDQAYEGHLQHHGQIHGDGTYITLREGEYDSGAGSGWYYQVGIQLPRQISANDKFSLSPAVAGRHLEPVGEFDRLGFLRPGEFVATAFGNPTGGYMACDDDQSHGKLEIATITRDRVTFMVKLHAEIPRPWDVDIDRTFTLRREKRITMR